MSWFSTTESDDIKDPRLRNFRDTVIKTDPDYLQEYHSYPDPASKTRFLQRAIRDKASYFVGTTTRDALYERPSDGGRRRRTRRKRPRRKISKKSRKY